MKRRTVRILGIDFFNGSIKQAVDALKKGGLLTVPAAPALITIEKNRTYYKSLLESDVVIADSGYMALIWNLFNSKTVNRISGLQFIDAFIEDSEVRASKFVLVDPTAEDARINRNYLNNAGFTISPDDQYVAPFYDKSNIVDPVLLATIEEKRPEYVWINLGGGVQEVLGAYLRKNLSYKPAIICTGAAIAFLTGRQATMPRWADRLFMGWLVRCFNDPRLFFPRYLKAFPLLLLLMRYGRKAPVTV